MGVFIFRAGFGNRSYWDTFDPTFADTDYKGPESEIASLAGRKTGLNIPYRMANRRSDGLEQGEREKNISSGGVVFRDLVLGCCRDSQGGEKIATQTFPEGHHFLDLIGPGLVQKMANSGTCF
jgi:hypothetical protein